MKRWLWLPGALLFAAGIVVQIEVRRDAADVAPAGIEPPDDSRAESAPEPAAAPAAGSPSDATPRSPAPEGAPAETPLPGPRRDDEAGALLEQRLEQFASAERLPADWADVFERLASPATPGVARRLHDVLRAHRDPEVAQQVLRTLERLAGAHAVRVLYEIGAERAELIADAAVRLSRVRGRESAPALLEIIVKPAAPDELVAAALRSLGHTALRQPVDDIRGIAADDRRAVDVRVAAVEALGWIADPVALADLVPLLRSPERALRRQAIRSIGRIRDPRSIAALEETVATGSNEQERLMAEDALARLRGMPRRRRW